MKKMVWIVVFSFLIVSSNFISYYLGVRSVKIERDQYNTYRIDSLMKIEKDLIEKIDILNNYLIIKHIEYIDACDLVHNSCKK